MNNICGRFKVEWVAVDPWAAVEDQQVFKMVQWRTQRMNGFSVQRFAVQKADQHVWHRTIREVVATYRNGETDLWQRRKYFKTWLIFSEVSIADRNYSQQVQIFEPSIANIISFLRGLKEEYEGHHGVRILD
ncbi:hypothetical protein F0562_007579 [Nyssa sinensis]|uniref:Uncharacterized protein n=1 Tax=Nyssa sinensis TaxID=561372 RepID=A0A5J5A699_9ASTE|nr:hypothetical protein F0562_007579 [Nyssa sinensis]